MDFYQFPRILEEVTVEFAENLPVYLGELAVDLNAQIQLRFQSEGKDSKGNKLKSYSTEYKKKRAKKGLQTNHVDFTVTGQLFGDIGIIKKQESGNKKEVVIGAFNSVNRAVSSKKSKKPSSQIVSDDIIKGLNDKYKIDFYALTESETEYATEFMNAKFLELLKSKLV